MLVNFSQMLSTVKKAHKAIGQFNIHGMEWTKEILLAAQECKYPVILGITENTVDYLGGYKAVVQMVKGLIESLEIDVDICLNLDHGKSEENCKAAIEAGFTAVMFDSAKLNIAENITITNRIVEYASRRGCSVEAQLGDYEANNTTYASLDDCFKFIDNTTVDCLAVSFGSKHATAIKTLDFSLLEALSIYSDLNISLHGGSGIPFELLKKAIVKGCCKVNINTENMYVWSAGVKDYLACNKHEFNPRKIIGSGMKPLRESVVKRINSMKYV